MDSAEEEDVSARVLLRNVLHTEIQRSPVTRSMSHAAQQLSRVRRSSRLRNAPESPYIALRHKLKQKLQETAVQSPLPPAKHANTLSRTQKTPAVFLSSALYDDDVTPRGLLRGILQTESEASLLLSGQTALPPVDPQDVHTSIHSNRQSDSMPGLELPDLGTEPVTHLIRGMSRKRPPPTFNISAFEKQLDQPSGEAEKKMDIIEVNPDVREEQDLSAASRSALSLTLKTPFVNLRSERAGLKRKAVGRQTQVTVDTFAEAVQKHLERRHNQDYTLEQDGKTLEDTDWHKITMGLSNVTVPEFTIDVMMNNTELYTQPQASASMSKLKKADEGVTETEMQRDDADVGDDNADVGDDADEEQDVQLNVYESNQHQQDPPEHLKPDSQGQEEEEDNDNVDVEMVPLSTDDKVVSPEGLPFALDRGSQPQEQEERESEIQEAQVEDMDQGEGESHQGDEKSHLPQRITHRAYHSEGGAMSIALMARGRGTKSLGRSQDLAEKQLKSFAGGSELKEVVSVQEEPHRGTASSLRLHTTRASSSEKHWGSLVQDEVDVTWTKGEEMLVSVRASPAVASFTVDFPAPEVEVDEHQQEEEEQEAVVVEGEQEVVEEGEQEVVEEEEQEVVEEEEQEVVEEEEQEVEEEEEQEAVEEEEEQEAVEEEEEREAVEEEEEQEAVEEEEEQEAVEEEEEREAVEEEEEREAEDDAQSEELSMQTPGFVRQRKRVSTPGALATPTILRARNAGHVPPKAAKPCPKAAKAAKPRTNRKTKSSSSTGVLPKSYVMTVFKHFAKTKVASDVYPVINDILQRYFDRLADDLEAYSAHAGRKTIEVEDVELLMRRQGFVTDNIPVTVFIEKYLPLEYRKLLIPVATSGNKVLPDRRR